jgi:hypothetical protein
MPDFLMRRGATWHFVRRVPAEFAALDLRGIVRHSTRIKIADDRLGRRASRVADKLNRELECFWKELAGGCSVADATRYETARRQARSLGYDYIPNSDLVVLPVIPPFLTGFFCRIHAASFSFCIGVMPPMPIFGRSLL